MTDESDMDELDCHQALDRLYDFLDMEMTPADVSRMQAHLSTCDGCASQFHVEQHLRTLLKRSCCEKAPTDLKVRIMAQITRLTVVTRESESATQETENGPSGTVS